MSKRNRQKKITVTPRSEPRSAMAVLREWLDALVIAFVLAMFIRIFLVELFKIPTGSMTPTLIGGEVVRADVNHDGREDLLLLRAHQPPLAFHNDGERLKAMGPLSTPPSRDLMRSQVRQQFDRILVNKFAYWFHSPDKGDIVVFKVPERIFEVDKPIYIKRCVGEPGDVLTFDPEGHLQVSGKRVLSPSFFEHQKYVLDIATNGQKFLPQPGMDVHRRQNPSHVKIDRIKVPDDNIYVFGDNTHSSLDSRYWGGVELNRLKGRAFLRYWPHNQIKFLGGA